MASVVKYNGKTKFNCLSSYKPQIFWTETSVWPCPWSGGHRTWWKKPGDLGVILSCPGHWATDWTQGCRRGNTGGIQVSQAKMRRQDGMAMGKYGLNTGLVNTGCFSALDLLVLKWLWKTKPLASEPGRIKSFHVSILQTPRVYHFNDGQGSVSSFTMHFTMHSQSAYFGMHIVEVKETVIHDWDHLLSPGPRTLWLNDFPKSAQAHLFFSTRQAELSFQNTKLIMLLIPAFKLSIALRAKIKAFGVLWAVSIQIDLTPALNP